MSNKIDVNNTTKKMNMTEQLTIYYALRVAEALNTKLYLSSDKLKQYQRSFVNAEKIDIKDSYVTHYKNKINSLGIYSFGGSVLLHKTISRKPLKREVIILEESWIRFCRALEVLTVGIKLRPKRTRRLRPKFDTCDKCGCTEYLCGHIVDGKYI